MEGPRRKSGLGPEIEVNPGLGDDVFVEMCSSSTSENPYKAIGSISIVEVAILEISTPLP